MENLNPNSEDKLISIIIPVYNSEQYIEKCIQSLINQTYSNLEVIIVNDGSTDKSDKLLNELSSKDNRIKYYYQDNSGVSATRNFGLSKATGEYFMFVDADDYVENDFCFEMYRLICENDSDIAFCNYYVEDKNGKYINNTKLENVHEFSSEQAIINILGDYGFKGFVWNKIYKSCYAKKIYFTEKICYLEDMLYNIQYLKQVNKVAVTKLPLYHYVQHSSSMVNSFSDKQLTLIDALAIVNLEIDERVEAIDIVSNKLKYSLIDFGSEFIKNGNLTKYKKMKNKYKVQQNIEIVNLRNSPKDKIIKVADYSFFLGAMLNFFFKALVFSGLYKRIKNILSEDRGQYENSD